MANVVTEITALSHPDSIWTWKSSARRGKVSLWIPYFSGADKVKGTTYDIHFQGGPIRVDLKTVDLVLFYGATGSLDLEFLDVLNQHRVPLMIHRRNQTRPMAFAPSSTIDQRDVLTRQIHAREDGRRRAYVARCLIRARIETMNRRCAIPGSTFARLRRLRSLESIRLLEAQRSKEYWKVYYGSLGLEGLGRRDDHPVNAALDAGSFFLFGVLLRWILFHRMSPAHGFMHEPTDYESLAYDLLDPYRVFFEDAVFASRSNEPETESLTESALKALKASLAASVYVPQVRAWCPRKSLLHGVVLALRAYLVGDMQRFVIPQEGERKGGRPPRVSYGLPGARRAVA